MKEEKRDGSRVCVCGGGLGFGLVWFGGWWCWFMGYLGLEFVVFFFFNGGI